MFKHTTTKMGHQKKFKDKVIERLYGHKVCEEITRYQSESEDECVEEQEKVKEEERDSKQVPPDFKVNSGTSSKAVQQKSFDVNTSIDAKDASFSLQPESDESGAEATPIKRRRHAKHKCSSSNAGSEVVITGIPSLTNYEDKEGSVNNIASENNDSTLKLSKNQRRKLKKKRREKEKSAKTGIEFTFEVTKGLKTTNIEEKRTSVTEFLDAVWEVYSVQNSQLPSSSNEAELMNSLQCQLNNKESYDMQEIELLFSVISTLVLNDKERSRTKIEEYSKQTNLNNDSLEYLSRYTDTGYTTVSILDNRSDDKLTKIKARFADLKSVLKQSTRGIYDTHCQEGEPILPVLQHRLIIETLTDSLKTYEPGRT